jgi:hypothetical protein
MYAGKCRESFIVRRVVRLLDSTTQCGMGSDDGASTLADGA